MSSFARYIFKARNLIGLTMEGFAAAAAAPRAHVDLTICVSPERVAVKSRSGRVTAQPLGPALNALKPGARIDLVLEEGARIDISFDVPMGTLAETRSMIDVEMGFRSPFDAAEALTVWKAHEVNSGGWNVEGCVVLRALVAPVLDALAETGHKLSHVHCSRNGRLVFSGRPDWIAADQPSELTTRLFALSRIPSALRPVAIAGAAFACSAIALTTMLSMSAGASAKAAQQARSEMAALASERAAVRAIEVRRESSLRRLELLGTLTALMPADVWLEQFSVDGDKISITGYAPSAAVVTELLTRTEGLADIKYGAPVTRDNSGKTERFRIAARLDGEIK